MGNVGGGEVLVILLVALLVLGPQRLPEAARQVGKAFAEFRKVSTGFQRELRSALDAETQPPPQAQVPTGLAQDVPSVAPSAEPSVTAESAPPETETAP
jgi:sec-independent protein translocase protein TatB